jgi:hypothetical protein
MVREDNFQAAIDHTNEAIKTFIDLNNKIIASNLQLFKSLTV